MTPHVPHNYCALPGSEHHKVKGARRSKPVDPDETIRLLIRVRRPPDAAPAPDHSHWERTKPGQRKFLSRKELGEKYGASDADLQRVAAFARSKELKVLELHAARRLVIVTGTVRQLNHAFAVDLGHYETDDEEQPTYRGREGHVHVPKDIQHLIEGVFGLDDRRAAHRLKIEPSGLTSNGPGGNPLTPIDIANLYNFPPIPANMSDQTIGILEFGGGYTISPSTPGQPTDVDTFLTNLNASYIPPLTLSPANVIPVPLGGGANKVSGQGSKGQINDIEVALDIEVVAAVANGSTIAVYFAPASEAGYLEIVLAAIFPDNGQPAPSVISTSWESDELNWSASALQTVSSAFQQAAEAGITILATSGDQGTDFFYANDGKAHVAYPASDPWITTCGGTQISKINWTNSTTASTFVENTWNQGTSNGQSTGITGGGISTVKDSSGNPVFPLPSWQQGLKIGPSINDGTTFGRGIPDIAGYSNGYNITCYGQPFNNVAGTSEAAPLYAGLIARINATLGFNVGYLNPTLYSLFSSPGLFNDIHDKVSNAFTFQLGTPPAPVTFQTSPGYRSVVGWDACTGLGSLDGTKLLEALSGSAIPSSFYFSVSKNTFGSQEVNQTLIWPAAFSLVLDGFSLSQVTQNPPVFSGSFITSTGVKIPPTIPHQELGGSDNALQRITFLFDIHFPPNPNSYFPGIGNTSTLSLVATLQTSVPGTPPLTATAQFELIAGADPFVLNVSQTFQNPWYLSQDLRVLTVCPQVDSTPVVTWQQMSSNLYDTAAAFNYVQTLITYLNDNFSDPTQADPFTTLLPLAGGLTGDSSVTPYSIDPNTREHHSNYNFAVARVRLSGGVASVSTFFRLFLTASNDTDYQPSTTYATTTTLPGTTLTPLISDPDDPLTIPFFATGNYENNLDADVETDYTNTGPNARLLQTTSGTGGVWAYFGCYLNVYNTQNTISGNPIVLTGTHHCLVAEISHSGTPITTGTSVANSAQLAQRNLQITPADNPGPPATHRVPQTFDMRPSPPFNLALATAGDLLNWPDELVIDWGNVPAGSTASVYWPGVQAADAIAAASKLYATHDLTAPDAHTLVIRNVGVGKTSYVPVPSSTSAQSFAGLLTVDLPHGIVAGQEFTAVVSRWTTKQATAVAPPPSVPRIAIASNRPPEINNWRYATGSFAVTIPVATPATLLQPEKDVLAIFRWRLSQLPTTNRWYPVLQRYIGYVEGRVRGLGGNPITVVPSPYGAPPGTTGLPGGGFPIGGGGGGFGGHGRHGGHGGHDHGKHGKHTGKVEGLVYDRFGDFEGFVFHGEDGSERRFRSRSSRIEELIRRAWRQQMLVTVFGEHGDPVELTQIILREWPQMEKW